MAPPAAAGDAALLAAAGNLSQGLLADGGGSSLRAFTFSVDLQHFAASSRLPLNLASVVLELELPPELTGLIQHSNGRLPAQLAPLRTSAVAVARGSEAALPGGRASCNFVAGLMSVATLLARNPVMAIDVHHQERLADDMLLGRAHVPLAPLLQESWVDGRAGAYALVPTAADPAQHERVQIGTVHLVMSLEETGPVPMPAAAAAGPAAAPLARGGRADAAHAGGGVAAGQPALPASRPGSAGLAGRPHAAALPAELQAVQPGAVIHQQQQQQQQWAATVSPGRARLSSAEPAMAAAAAAGDDEPQAGWLNSSQSGGMPASRHPAADVGPAPPAAMHQAAAAAAPPAASQQAAAAAAPAGVQQAGQPVPDCFAGPEFEAAWQLELWKKEEEARWRRELQEREGRRMAALEEAWRRREAERDAEAASLRSEYSSLEAKARQVLAAAEERESRVVAAEEAVGRRRRELEKEHAVRVAEAEAAVRRLQAECQHQLELEQQRREALAQQKTEAQARAAAAEARVAAAERAAQQQKERHERSEAGRLEAELLAVRAELAAAEQRAAKAAEAKRKYKEQVVRLAQEVALLQAQLAELAGLKRRQLDAELAQLQAQEQALAARRDAAELGELKQQLKSLQFGGSSSGAGALGAGASAGMPASGATGGWPSPEKENAEGWGAAAAGGEDACRPVVLQGQLSEAVQRLMGERELLLGSGAYAADDPLIEQLDRRIRECASLAQRGQQGGTAAAS